MLPLENLSADADNAFFADGVHAEIQSTLSQIDGLTVISRNSAIRYRDSAMSLPEIGEELGVTHVLDGTVRRAGDRVRITMQLVSAADDHQVWTETYDRQLNDIFEP